MTHVLFCEDEEKYVEDFINDLGGSYDKTHGKHEKIFLCGDFRIEVCRNLNALDARLKNEKLPDILILDLFWPKSAGADLSDFNRFVTDFNVAVDNLVYEAQRYVMPRGYHFLEDDIRRHMDLSKGDLPVLMYTKAGLYLLDSDKRGYLAKNDVDFVLKRDAPETKKTFIRRAITKYKYRNDVFISYSSSDEQVASEIKHGLENYNMRVYWAPHNRPGDEFNDVIRENIQFSKVVALILSSRALDNKWVMWEIGACWALCKKIMPCCLGIEPTDVPAFISARHHVAKINSTKSREEYLNHIRRECIRKKLFDENDQAAMGI